ncbi:MATE family efflux transporter [Clostridiaceae bacterium]|nr:MATE family efflux transporter [Clostridiaceae bacterium]RKI12421.1 MATE family efflux transporter [bacterium 1XD21-70]
MKTLDLTKGNITKTLLQFALPMIMGNLLQQMYNVTDTLIVGRYIGREALAAVGSAYTLMTFLNSILLGFCMGSGVMFSVCYGKKDFGRMKQGMFLSFVMIGLLTLAINGAVFVGLDKILVFLRVPEEVYAQMREYLWIIFWGITSIFVYNYFASLLRAVGNSVVPLAFLGVSAVSNIILDLVFVLVFGQGIAGAAWATVLAQIFSGAGIAVYTLIKFPEFRPGRAWMKWDWQVLKEIFRLSFLTSVQQSVMNFGILMVQGLVNSFGPIVMAAFAAAVKIDSFAYMPVQDFGNAFSTFVAQNVGAGEEGRIRKGIRSAGICTLLFCLIITAGVCLFARALLLIFVQPEEWEVLAVGTQYLRIEGAFYCLIGFLFLFYGYFRAMGRPGMSVVLTVVSLGTRVVLAYTLSSVPWIGVKGIWLSVPVGWFLADAVGLMAVRKSGFGAAGHN